MSAFTNIAAYKFASLTDLKPLREKLLGFCKDRGLKGTILLSTEGINLFIAGPPLAVDELMAELRRLPGLETLTPKRSGSDHQPFNRMLVRIKKEIISFGIEGIDPAAHTSPKLAPQTLKQWLDEGRPVTLLDTRNDYEVKLGTFKGARTLDIGHFRQFPEAVRQLPETMKDEPIVMFCTGGIRCEKAGPFMEREGFRNVFQLEGGILKYFEDCGGGHYDGECFVFDQRTGVDPALHETGSALCYACLTPLTEEDQADPRFDPPNSCLYCYKEPAELMVKTLADLRERIRAAAFPLPGGQSYANRRPLKIPALCTGFTLLHSLNIIFPHVAEAEWKRICAEERFVSEKDAVLNTDSIMRGGERIFQLMPAAAEPEVNVDIVPVYADEALFVLHKPAPLPMHPCGRYNRNTLEHILRLVFAPLKPRSLHRLDANTTGLVVFARTRHFAKLLQPQFQNGEAVKVYLAKTQGHPPEDEFAVDAPVSAAPSVLGSREIDEEDGLPARTEFRVLRRDADGTALLEARPQTGRTNQIRVHLWQLGFPVYGDPAYLADGRHGETQTLPVDAPPLCLHAWRLSFTHPLTKEHISLEATAPDWALL